MSFLLKPFTRQKETAGPIKPGVYHYQAPANDARNYRLHLRVEADGSGILIVNAATVLHLNQTATEYAYYLVQSLPAEQAAKKVADHYQVSIAQAQRDYLDLAERIQTLINSPDLDPVTFLDFDRQAPYSGRISAPYRLDCALTYRMLADAAADAAPNERVKSELNLEEWKVILDKAWKAGIPHVVFTGGEPTLREDLPALIAHAEKNNMVTGLLTEGQRLAEKAYLQTLLQTGLDHLMILLQPEDEDDWQAIQNALVEDIFVAVHLTIDSENQAQIPVLLNRLAEMGVRAISLSAGAEGLEEAIEAARELVANLDLELVWSLPVPYSKANPVTLETSGLVSQPEGAGRAWLYVEPDGDVLPGQGINQVLGNLLTDSWERVWQKG
jgi:organic radical activating enzyme